MADLGSPNHLIGAVIGPNRALLDSQARSMRSLRQRLPVLGHFDDLESILTSTRANHVLLTLPISLRRMAEDLAQRLDRTKVEWRFLPSIADQLAGRIGTSEQVSGSMAHQSGRTPIDLLDIDRSEMDEQAVGEMIRNRIVMITGATHEFGSELARAISKFGPSRIVLVDQSKSKLLAVDREIARMFPALKRSVVAHDFIDTARARSIVALQRPALIFHVPFSETAGPGEPSLESGVDRYFYGTRFMADAAHSAGADRFMLVWTDPGPAEPPESPKSPQSPESLKLAEPSVAQHLGPIIQLGEWYLQHISAMSRTSFGMVRIGTVLTESGCLLQTWKRQLEMGGPINVVQPNRHHPFRSTPEAAALSLQSAAMLHPDQGHEIFALRPARSIRLDELARRFIVSQGLEPDVDIEIAAGSPMDLAIDNPLAFDGEARLPTEHQEIQIVSGADFANQQIEQIISTLDRLRGQPNRHGLYWQHAGRDTIASALEHVRSEIVEFVGAPESS